MFSSNFVQNKLRLFDIKVGEITIYVKGREKKLTYFEKAGYRTIIPEKTMKEWSEMDQNDFLYSFMEFCNDCVPSKETVEKIFTGKYIIEHVLPSLASDTSTEVQMGAISRPFHKDMKVILKVPFSSGSYTIDERIYKEIFANAGVAVNLLFETAFDNLAKETFNFTSLSDFDDEDDEEDDTPKHSECYGFDERIKVCWNSKYYFGASAALLEDKLREGLQCCNAEQVAIIISSPGELLLIPLKTTDDEFTEIEYLEIANRMLMGVRDANRKYFPQDYRLPITMFVYDELRGLRPLSDESALTNPDPSGKFLF